MCEFPPPPGGMAQQAEMLVELLRRDGISVQKCKINFELPIFLKPVEKKLAIKLFIKFPLLLWRLFASSLGCSVIHIFSIPGMWFFDITAPSVFIAKLLRKKSIINYHAGFFKDFYDKHKKIVSFILNLADCITTPLKFLEPEFAQAGFRITSVPNIADLKRFRFKKRKKLKPNFLSTRHLRWVYGVDCVIRAFSLIVKDYPEAHLTIAGDGDMAKSLKKLTYELGISGRVSFVGYVEGNELVKLYEEADIFLNGSRRDNMPISILEAFATGLPVVSTNPMGIPHLVENEVSGLLVDIDDFENLAKGAFRILSDPEMSDILVRNGKAVVDSLTWENIRPRLLDVYGLIADQHSSHDGK